jgi:hypothetical protein
MPGQLNMATSTFLRTRCAGAKAVVRVWAGRRPSGFEKRGTRETRKNFSAKGAITSRPIVFAARQDGVGEYQPAPRRIEAKAERIVLLQRTNCVLCCKLCWWSLSLPIS